MMQSLYSDWYLLFYIILSIVFLDFDDILHITLHLNIYEWIVHISLCDVWQKD